MRYNKNKHLKNVVYLACIDNYISFRYVYNKQSLIVFIISIFNLCILN